jgi:hypothetical protein
VLVQTSGVGVERKTELLSSNSGGFRTVPSTGNLAGSEPPEAVLGDRVSRPAPPPEAVAGAASPGQPPLSRVESATPGWAGAGGAASVRETPSIRERLETMKAETAERAAQPRRTLLPIWQIALLGLAGVAGLGGSIYGMTWLARPRYVVRVIEPARRAPRHPAPPRRPSNLTQPMVIASTGRAALPQPVRRAA